MLSVFILTPFLSSILPSIQTQPLPSRTMLSLVWLLLFTATSAYRIMEYDRERCTHNGFRSYQLAHANNACQKLNVRVASSILVKLDNVHDDQYQLNVYDNNDCTGDAVGAISNLNGCMNLFSLDNNRVGRSVKLTPRAALTEPERESTGKGFEAGLLFNADDFGKENKIMVPIARGVFQHVNRSDRSDDGTYRDDAIESFFPKSLKRLLAEEAQESWDNLDADEYIDADEFELLASEKWHERLLNQGGFYFNRAYAAAADWGEWLIHGD